MESGLSPSAIRFPPSGSYLFSFRNVLKNSASKNFASSAITPWHGPARGFSFVREVQPVLDRYCVSCHGGEKNEVPFFKGGVPLTNWTSQLSGRWTGGGKFTDA